MAGVSQRFSVPALAPVDPNTGSSRCSEVPGVLELRLHPEPQPGKTPVGELGGPHLSR